MKEQITEIILLIAPSIITILSMIGVIAKVIANFKALKKDVVDMKEMKEVKDYCQAILKENYELRQLNKELLTKIDHVKRYD